MQPLISIVVPVHDMRNGDYFLNRLHDSIRRQTYKNYEIIVTREGKMAENTNAGIKKAEGEIIKILFMDDYLHSPDALQHIVDNLGNGWYASGCVHTTDGQTFFKPHYAKYSNKVKDGLNTIGSPSVVAFRNSENPILFDENMSWLLDCDWYARMYEECGEPVISDELDVAIGIGDHQMTNIMSDRDKLWEAGYLQGKNEVWKNK